MCFWVETREKTYILFFTVTKGDFVLYFQPFIVLLLVLSSLSNMQYLSMRLEMLSSGYSNTCAPKSCPRRQEIPVMMLYSVFPFCRWLRLYISLSGADGYAFFSYRNRTTKQLSESTGKLCATWMFAGRKKRQMKVIIQFLIHCSAFIISVI